MREEILQMPGVPRSVKENCGFVVGHGEDEITLEQTMRSPGWYIRVVLTAIVGVIVM